MSGCHGWEAVNPLCQAGHVLGGAATSAGNDIFGSIADYFAGVAKAAVGWLWGQLNDATSIDLTSAGIRRDLIATGAIAGVITFGLFLIQVIASALRQDGAGLGRAVRGLGVSFVGAAFAVACTQVLLAAVDGLCNGVVRFALHTNVAGLGQQLVVAQTLASIGNPAGLLLLSLVLIGAVVVVWVALMIRKLLIVVSAVFAPIAFAGAASDVSRSWVRRWIEFTLALIFSKLILVIVFLIGLSVLDGAGQSRHGARTVTTATTTLIIGALTLLLAGFAPWIAVKMVHFAGESFHTVHAQAAGATSGAQTAVAVPRKVVATAHPYAVAAGAGARAARGGRGGAAGPPGAQPKSAAAQSSTHRSPDFAAAGAAGHGRSAPTGQSIPGQSAAGQSAPRAGQSRSGGGQR